MAIAIPAKHKLAGIGIERNVNAGTKRATQKPYARTVLETDGMADARPTKTPVKNAPQDTKFANKGVLSPANTTFFNKAQHGGNVVA